MSKSDLEELKKLINACDDAAFDIIRNEGCGVKFGVPQKLEYKFIEMCKKRDSLLSKIISSYQ